MTDDPTKTAETDGASGKTGKKGPRIIVSCTLPGGRRRAGYAFGPEPTEIVLDNLKKEQLEAIEADPLLSTKRLS